MAQAKQFVFDPRDLYKLLCHYSDGLVPLDGDVTNFGFHPALTKYIAIEVESKEWDSDMPLILHYEGNRIMSWTKGSGEDPSFQPANETPKRQ